MFNQQQIKLDPLESLVLEELAKHPKDIISGNDLLNLWPTNATSPNSLTRVISTLRKKLRNLDSQNVEIKNYPKKGYALIADVEHALPEKTKSPDNSRNNAYTITVAALTFLVFLALIVNYITSQSIVKSGSSIPPILGKAIQLIDDPYEKVDLSVNDTHTQVIYATRDSEQAFWQLVLLNTYSLKRRVITEANWNLRTPDWLDDNTIVFRAYNDTKCSIKKLNLSSLEAQPIALFPCNELTTGKGLSVLSPNTILFTDAAHDIAPASLYKGNLQTGKATRISKFESGGVGVYNIQSKADSNLVAILTSADWSTGNIHLVDINDSWKSIWQIKTPKAKHSVSWDGNALLHANESGGVTAHIFNQDAFIKSIEMSGFSKLYNFVGNDGSVAFIQGSMYRTDVLMSPIKEPDGVETLLVGTRASNKLAQFINENEVIYVSDATGIEQLWSVDINTQIKRQISTFAKAQQIENVAFDDIAGIIALESSGLISLYSFANDKVNDTSFLELKGSKPQFYDNNLLFNTHDGADNYRIDALNLDSQELDSEFLLGAHEIQVSNGQLYYTKYYQPGLWRYDALGEDELVSSMSQDVSYWFIDNNNLLYKAKGEVPFLVDIENGKVSKLSNSICQHITDYQFGVCLGQHFKPNSTQLMLAETNQ
ncbi:winged helix-turn-helix domain-containing protein [Thalassotalea euphylliae]|uniref:winged helix-turn-helix domain-containing protein n=1 Tax=Thalassotalea euphylliae TaxID=1655234 RepID=UPI0015F2875B|nr:winged helix-turn-helix domain-containing protein [Thalassotalea euphylliae]